MTRDEFLNCPLDHLFKTAGFVPPPDWIRAAWADTPFRREAIYSLSRSVSKVGSLKGASDWLSLLGSALSPTQAAELYQSIRDASERSETEWRKDFEVAFPESASLLPPINRHRELFNKTLGLFCAIYWAEPEKIRSRVQALLNGDFRLNDAKMCVADFAKFPEGEECLTVIGPLDPKHSLSALSLASSLKQEEIVDFLRKSGATE